MRVVLEATASAVANFNIEVPKLTSMPGGTVPVARLMVPVKSPMDVTPQPTDRSSPGEWEDVTGEHVNVNPSADALNTVDD